MKDNTRLYIGPAIVVVGLLWTARGLGWLGGSFMSGELLWAFVGPLVVVAGVLVALRARNT